MELNEAVQSLLRDVVPDGHIAIDLGIGPGRITEFLQSRGFTVHGCDINPEHAESARRRRVHAEAADVLEWEPSTHADVITCIELIEHLPAHRQPELLRRIRRWLRPGGTAILSTPQRHSLVATVERVYWGLRGRAYDWWDPTHVAVRTRRDLHRMLAGGRLAHRPGGRAPPDAPTGHRGRARPAALRAEPTRGTGGSGLLRPVVRPSLSRGSVLTMARQLRRPLVTSTP